MESPKLDSTESDQEFEEAVPVKGSLSVVGRNIKFLPKVYSDKYGRSVNTLDLSHNKIVFVYFNIYDT